MFFFFSIYVSSQDNDKKLATTNSPDKQQSPNSINSNSNNKLNDLLSHTNFNNQMMQNIINHQNGYLKNHSSNSSRSSTLDRKMRPTDNTTQNSGSLSFKLFSSSLERNKHNQQQQLALFKQQHESQYFSNDKKKP